MPTINPPLTDQQLLEALDLRDNHGMTLEKIGQRFGRTKNSMVGALHRLNVETAQHECFCEKSENKDGGMPNGWWK